jgi:HAD superfamily hydrolase (TIGR01490 family)
MKKKVAIFDVDGTIFRSSLLIELVELLIERKVFPSDARLEYGKEYLAWLDRRGSYQDYLMAVVDVFLKYLKGARQDEVLSAATTVIKQQEQRLYRYTRDLIRSLKDQGYYLLAISHSPKFILDDFCRSLGFDKVYGLLYEVKEGKFTGKILEEELVFDKAKILERAVEKENLTLDDSIGVGDTDTDVSFLSKVSQPICFNPNSKLYEHAKAQNWKVIVERKDVIYELS